MGPSSGAMTRMLKELNEHPEMGFLGVETTLNFPTTLMLRAHPPPTFIDQSERFDDRLSFLAL